MQYCNHLTWEANESSLQKNAVGQEKNSVIKVRLLPSKYKGTSGSGNMQIGMGRGCHLRNSTLQLRAQWPSVYLLLISLTQKNILDVAFLGQKADLKNEILKASCDDAISYLIIYIIYNMHFILISYTHTFTYVSLFQSLRLFKIREERIICRVLQQSLMYEDQVLCIDKTLF